MALSTVFMWIESLFIMFVIPTTLPMGNYLNIIRLLDGTQHPVLLSFICIFSPVPDEVGFVGSAAR